jgi:hypothetical protein
MQTDRIYLVQGDTLPQVQVVLRDSVSDLPVDLVGATPRLYFRASGTKNRLASVLGALQAGFEDAQRPGVVITTPPWDTPGRGGRVLFQFGPGDLDVPGGEYEGEIEVSFSDGSVQTVYQLLRFRVREQF